MPKSCKPIRAREKSESDAPIYWKDEYEGENQLDSVAYPEARVPTDEECDEALADFHNEEAEE